MMVKGVLLIALVVMMIVSGVRVEVDGPDQKYKEREHVLLYTNKVGPFHNPSETYRYYDLLFCVPENVKEKREDLGEVLNGSHLVDAPYELNFHIDKQTETPCKKRLSKEEVVQLRSAVLKDYYFQMYYDDLPFWGFLEKVKKENKMDPRFLATILMRVPKYDFIKYSHDEDFLDDQEETDWKCSRDDVFRYPKHKSLFSAILGSGTQLLTLGMLIFFLVIVRVFYPYNRGALFTALVVIYALISGIVASYGSINRRDGKPRRR
ncbi:hypothetical protein GIB67_021092 [Kingdonia uniflora]|uniref:Transmembrane 9 superfamily member n=1 Tax=Kingdonia uniflora TaxID=39325 RepID=A0A7J7N779_9MAGN|nr:hypothetical protein GIB67_021092 [Kingdonia uniflora]